MTKVLAGAATEPLISEYLEPWTEEGVRRSWMNLAGAADYRHTMELLPALLRSTTPKLLVRGEDDVYQKVAYAERFVCEVLSSTLIRIPEAGHIPMENAPEQVARALADFFNA